MMPVSNCSTISAAFASFSARISRLRGDAWLSEKAIVMPDHVDQWNPADLRAARQSATSPSG